MEDIIIVVWVAMIIIGSLINAANKRRAKEQTAEEQLPTPEEIREILQREQRPMRPNTAPQHPAYETLEGQSIESESLDRVEPYAPNVARTRKRQKSAPSTATTKRTAQRATAPAQSRPATQPAASQQGTEREDLTCDFDLERAVVYSEILRPKYQDYE